MKATDCVNGLKFTRTEVSAKQCDGCAHGKSKRKLFPTSGHTKVSQISQLVNSDLCGPISVASPGELSIS